MSWGRSCPVLSQITKNPVVIGPTNPTVHVNMSLRRGVCDTRMSHMQSFSHPTFWVEVMHILSSVQYFKVRPHAHNRLTAFFPGQPG